MAFGRAGNHESVRQLDPLSKLSMHFCGFECDLKRDLVYVELKLLDKITNGRYWRITHA